MSNEPQDSDNRGADRILLDRAVQLRFGKFQDFLTEVAGNISPGGMFIKTDEPHRPGEGFEFECSLADGFPLVCGSAEVVWVRESSPAPDQPAGMGVRFTELGEESAELIEKILEHRLGQGESTFDLESEGVKAGVAAAAQGRRGAEPESGSEPSSEGAPEEISAEIVAATERLVEASGSPGETAWSRVDEAEMLEAPEPSEDTALPPAGADDVSTNSEEPESSEQDGAVEAPAKTEADVEPQPELQPGLQPVLQTEPEVVPEVVEVEFEERPPERPRTLPRVSLPESERPEPLPAAVPRPDQAAPVVHSPAAQARVAQARPTRSRLRLRRLLDLTVFALLIGAAAVLVFNEYWVRPRIDRLETRLEDLTGSSRVGDAPGRRWVADSDGVDETQEAGETSAAVVDLPRLPNAPEVEKSDPAAEVADRVQAWALAWSRRRVDEYLSFYSADFSPDSGGTREAWEARRRDRLRNQGSIRVAVVSMEVEEVSPAEVLVTFTQPYRSDTFRDRVRKTLRMVWEDDSWKISEEAVIRQLPW